MLHERLKHWAEKSPDKTALQIRRGEAYARVTYRQLWERARSAASVLLGSGIQPGGRVALFADNGPEWAMAYLGIHLAGAVVVPIDAQYTAAELNNLLSFSGARGLVIDDAHRETVEQLDPRIRADLKTWSFSPEPPGALFTQQPPAGFDPHVPDPGGTMSIIFTSGTTGEPKGVQLLVRNIGSNIEGILEAIDLTPRDNLLNVLPLHHAYACTVGLLTPLAAGATVTFSASLRGPDLMAALQETGVTVFPGVPQLFVLLDRGIFQKVNSLKFAQKMAFNRIFGLCRSIRRTTGLRLGKLLLPSVHRQFGTRLRFLASGGAKLDPEVAGRLMDLGFLVIEGYGLSETSPVVAFTSVRKPRIGSVGNAIRGVEIKINNPDASGQGEILVKGPNVMAGYYNNEKATSEVLRDGWFHTGDLGFLDKDGMLFITGRAKDVIVLPSGKNIYPDEIEARYMDAPLVKEICVFQEKSESGAEAGLCAAVVADMEKLAALGVPNVLDRIRFEIRRRGMDLPSYMSIGDVVLLDGPLPRTRLGKFRRPLIMEEVALKRAGRKDEVQAALTPEAQAMIDDPQGAKALARLAEVLDIKDPLTPGMDLQMDLGVDSLSYVQMMSMLEDEFGVVIPENEVALVRTVGDVLKRVIENTGGGGIQPASLSWKQQLARRARPSLAERFNLSRGPLGDFGVLLVVLLARPIIWLLFRPRVEGSEKIPRDGALLVCPSHQSYIDASLMMTQLPWHLVRRMLFFAFGEIFDKPPLSWLVKAGRVIKTGGAGTLAESLQLSAEGLERGMAVCIFPEGGMTMTGDIAAPKPGAGILACEKQARVLPVLIDGSIACLSHLNTKFHPCRVRIRIGDPFDPPKGATFTAEDYNNVVQEWKSRIIEEKQKS